MSNKRGGKREGAGRPSKNSVIKPISLPLELFQFVKNNNLSLSKLAQQKIREEMARRKQIVDYVETDIQTAFTLLEENKPIHFVTPTKRYKKLSWINVNNETVKGEALDTIQDAENGVFEIPIFEGQETVF